MRFTKYHIILLICDFLHFVPDLPCLSKKCKRFVMLANFVTSLILTFCLGLFQNNRLKKKIHSLEKIINLTYTFLDTHHLMSDIVERVHHFLLESRLNKDQALTVKSALTIVEILVSAKCCFRCCLRFLGCTNFGLYALEEAVKYTKLFKKKKRELFIISFIAIARCV